MYNLTLTSFFNINYFTNFILSRYSENRYIDMINSFVLVLSFKDTIARAMMTIHISSFLAYAYLYSQSLSVNAS